MTRLALAERVGTQGEVTGVDLCDAFLDIARQEFADTKLRNVRFLRGDAEAALPGGAYDFVFARFCTMFSVTPVAGLRNMRRALRQGGRMTHIVWRNPAEYPWLSMAKAVVLRFLPPPGEEARSCGPGPFSMADEATTCKMMETVGWEDIVFKRAGAPVLVGDDVRDAIAFQLAIGPAGEVVREAGAIAEERRTEIEEALVEAIARQRREGDGIVMESSSRVIGARNAD